VTMHGTPGSSFLRGRASQRGGAYNAPSVMTKEVRRISIAAASYAGSSERTSGREQGKWWLGRLTKSPPKRLFLLLLLAANLRVLPELPPTTADSRPISEA